MPRAFNVPDIFVARRLGLPGVVYVRGFAIVATGPAELAAGTDFDESHRDHNRKLILQ